MTWRICGTCGVGYEDEIETHQCDVQVGDTVKWPWGWPGLGEFRGRSADCNYNEVLEVSPTLGVRVYDDFLKKDLWLKVYDVVKRAP